MINLIYEASLAQQKYLLYLAPMKLNRASTLHWYNGDRSGDGAGVVWWLGLADQFINLLIKIYMKLCHSTLQNLLNIFWIWFCWWHLSKIYSFFVLHFIIYSSPYIWNNIFNKTSIEVK